MISYQGVPMKELNKNHFVLELIKDLGMKPISGNRTDSGKPRKARFVLLKCQCGNTFETRCDIGKKAKSCRTCSTAKAAKTHGESKSHLYSIWQSMVRRVKSDPNYAEISCCSEWQKYENFRDWSLINGYTKELEIDRIDNSKDYKPSNCRWVTRQVQGRNTRQLFAHNTSGYRGVCYDKSRDKWVSYIKVNNQKKHLGRFSNKLEAAKAYDTYVVLNNLEHTINGVLHESIQPKRNPQDKR